MQRVETVLILPGDVRHNLGDTAICLGILGTLRRARKGCRVRIHSAPPLSFQDFKGVRFERWYRPKGLLTEASADLVVWGGGQLLQGNRSRLKIPLWFLRIGWLRLVRRAIIGLAQGVGPLQRRLDRWMTRRLVGWTRGFSVRDRFSEEELLASGVPAESFHRTSDPALLLPQLMLVEPLASPVSAEPSEAVGGDGETPRLRLSLRFTLHHRENRTIPFQLLPARTRERARQEAGFDRYLRRIQELASRLAHRLEARIVLVPMYLAPWESDMRIARSVEDHLQAQGLEAEIFTPGDSLRELLEALGRLEAFIGTPMHSTILSTAMHVPTCALYYEPKGLSYFESIGAGSWAYPLGRLLEEGGAVELEGLVKSLWQQRTVVRRQLAKEISARTARTAHQLEELLRPLETLHPTTSTDC